LNSTSGAINYQLLYCICSKENYNHKTKMDSSREQVAKQSLNKILEIKNRVNLK